MKMTKKRLGLAAFGAATLTFVIIALLPSAVPVDAGRAVRGGMRVTVEEEGETQAHDRYAVAALVTGRLSRIQLHDGDRVARNQVVALINPAPIDPREEAETRARLQVAEALKRGAEEFVERARAQFEQARRERERSERLHKDGYISLQTLEQAKNAEIAGAKELEEARFKSQAAESEVKVVQAVFLAIEPKESGTDRMMRLRSPISGRVLRVIEKSERVVPAGTPLLVIGDPSKLEVVVDVLSTDAVKLRPGMPVLLEHWGGEPPIRARVRTVEPSAFTKVSALGIEEQRVNVVADFVDPPGPLGDGYRVEAEIITWEGENVLKVPASALFRRDQGWSVFVVEGGRARQSDVEIGHRNEFEVEILKGIEEGAQVILHPTNQIADGVRVKVR